MKKNTKKFTDKNNNNESVKVEYAAKLVSCLELLMPCYYPGIDPAK